jgi:hypothetical protein
VVLELRPAESHASGAARDLQSAARLRRDREKSRSLRGRRTKSGDKGGGREGERLAAALAQASEDFRRVIAATAGSENNSLPEACRAADRELCGVHDRIISGERLTLDEIENKLAAVEDGVTQSLWATTDPSDRQVMLDSARAELRSYETRMEREVFEETVRRRVSARLRENFGLPRLSLFYL